MKRIILIFAILMGGACAMLHAETPMQRLEKARSRLAAAQSVTAAYTVQVTGGGRESRSSGTLTVSGMKFHNDTPDLKVWFDGRTQWTYAPSLKEVSIIEPTEEELVQTNPLAILQNLSRSYKAVRSPSPAGTYAVKLTPQGKGSEIRSAVVTLSDKSGLPTRIEASMSDGSSITIAITSLKTGGALPPSTFTYSAAKAAAGTRLNDLR